MPANLYALGAIALWVLLASLGVSLRAAHVLAALLGFAGAAVAILGARTGSTGGGWAWGYLPALGSAFIWASYSLLTKRVRAFPTAAIGSLALGLGGVSLPWPAP